MPKFPRDRFDDLPADLQRVGAHRSTPRRGRGLVVFAWAALATGVLVGGGVVALGVLNDSIQFDAPTTTATETAEAEAPDDTASATPTEAPVTDPADVDPSVTIAVLNGTSTAGLATAASADLEAAGYTVATQGNAGDTSATTSTVYYADAADEGVALGLAQTLGVTATAVSSAFPNASVTVVLGADYTP
ncbi:LytR C-terminal domain-containing protein [Frigoribacterium sp. CFBP9039]|uniref:LytR C-terminal domain-containing protein n=1 Tax=Frigoribacterium TaxID=96492 RepID=UPI0017846126|nr:MULTISPECIES: LytR C-terminal domain-containing protein [Frigoribacterium]MBD8704518.1 LytR C-terminal domain-containing protein [Frigoribacterium sp. CFBP 13712]MCJ0701852.1 LytR C-terminal domain-containing protein [Frigoribacterium faeni]MDY0945618.1 LytR C-terminal domain-containing protein [Frigoribacterium sp. CFBP9039]